MRDGLITASFNECGTYTEIRELLITLINVTSNKGRVYLCRFVGMGSSKHVDDLDEEVR